MRDGVITNVLRPRYPSAPRRGSHWTGRNM